MSQQQEGPGRQDGLGVMHAQVRIRNLDDGASRQVQEIPVDDIPPFTSVSDSAQHFSGENVVKRECLEFGPDEVNQYGVSDVEEESFVFLWQLKNYSKLAENDEILSPIFTGGVKSKHCWQLRISPKNIYQGQECLGINLGLTDFGDGENRPGRIIKGRFQIKILDADWKPRVVADHPKWIQFKKTTEWGYIKILPAATLSSPSRRLLENNCLKIQCRVLLLGNAKQKVYSGGAAVRTLAEEEKAVVKNDALAFDMGKALKNLAFTDVGLKTVDGVFPAHKAILAARSPVLANIINDGEITTISINDFDGEIVQALLTYIYTGEAGEVILKRRAIDLLQAAEYYALDELKEDCELAIGESLTVDNAADILVMGNLYKASLLKAITMEFIDRHKEQICKTPSFQLVAKTRPDLVAELYVTSFVDSEEPVIINAKDIVSMEPEAVGLT